MQASRGQAGQEELLEQCAAVLEAGGVIGYPSETVWGLAARPDSRVGVDRLYQVKGRAAAKPVQLSCADVDLASAWLRPGQSGAERLFAFWPGPLTLVAWARRGCPEWLAPGGVVGVRVPAHPVIRSLLLATGGTLATTSLNPSGQPAATTAAQATAYGLADLLLNDPAQDAVLPPVAGLASTVFDLRTRQIVRQGAISETQLLQALA